MLDRKPVVRRSIRSNRIEHWTMEADRIERLDELNALTIVLYMYANVYVGLAPP